MRYCTNCGKELVENAKFCAFCGASVNGEVESKRRVVYEGDIHKCPNCGEVVGAFVAICPRCGFEFRNTQATNAVRELAEKIEKIENNRSSKQSGWKRLFDTKGRISETDQEKISLIRSFAMPNSKDDLFEFMVLASSNIDIQRYTNPHVLSASERAVSDAWQSRFEQSYKKAKLSIGDTPEFEKIRDIFSEKQNEIRRAKRRRFITLLALIGLPIMLYCMLLVWTIGSFSSSAVQEENDRLNALASEVYEAIDSKNYDIAKAKAANLVYTGPNTADGKEAAAKWDEAREKLMSVIENAEDANKAEGKMSLPSDGDSFAEYDDSVEESDEPIQIPDNFCDGYTKANFEDYNSPMDENGLGGTRIYFTGVLEKVELLNSEGNDYIVGCLKDDENNTWILFLNMIPLAEKTHYDAAVGQRVCCTGVYNGYFDQIQMPMAIVNEIFVFKDGTRLNGLQKILDTI